MDNLVDLLRAASSRNGLFVGAFQGCILVGRARKVGCSRQPSVHHVARYSPYLRAGSGRARGAPRMNGNHPDLSPGCHQALQSAPRLHFSWLVVSRKGKGSLIKRMRNKRQALCRPDQVASMIGVKEAKGASHPV